MHYRKLSLRLALIALFLWVATPPTQAQADRKAEQPNTSLETHYLAFQIFTGSADPSIPIGSSGMNALGPMPSEQALNAYVADILSRVGTVGQGRTRLAVIFGPLAFDQSDAQVRRFIASAFMVALQHNVAVGFHIDDSMFWAGRKDLWSNPDNVEWLDWEGSASTGRQLEWGPRPAEVAPQMCFNSPEIEAEVRHRAGIIGDAIQAGRTRLRQQGREDLFAGVIAGWETQIGQDFATGRSLGYHALTNRGFRRAHPPADPDAEREAVVQEFIGLWCRSLESRGVPPSRIYAHVAFQSRRLFDQNPAPTETYSQHNHFASPSIAFGSSYRPGFSTYPQPGFFEQVYSEMDRHGDPAWASSEGTDLQLGSGPGQSGMTMETYLAKMFNHGATLVNVFSWGVGGDAHKNMDFRLVTEGEDALGVYRKFLRGAPLVEAPSTSPSYLERLPAKIHRIQQELPAWIKKTRGTGAGPAADAVSGCCPQSA